MRKRQSIVFLISVLVLSSFHLHNDKKTTKQEAQITAGFQHSLLLHDNKVWFWGDYQDFNGNQIDLKEPALTINLSQLTAISEGATAEHMLAIKDDKTVWAWGNNKFGQLAIFESDYEPFPLKIRGLENIVQVVGGKGHSVALKEDGTVWTWGWNKYGQLGLGNNKNQSQVQKIPNLNNIVAISAGAKHTLALDKNGSVWSWGANHLGQLGLGKDDSTIQPEKISGLKDIKQISAGAYHNIALAKDGKMFAWGWNDFGQIGNNTDVNSRVPVYIPLNGVKEVKAGTLHNIVLTQNGAVWAWGNNHFNQCGAFKAGQLGIPHQVAGLKNITSLSAGDIHSVATDNNGNVWTWGNTGNGRLGRIDIENVEPTIAFNLNDLKEETNFTEVKESAKAIASKSASLEVIGLKHRDNDEYYEIPISNYIIDTMYHTIKIGEDVLLDKCPTEQALKKLDIKLKSKKDSKIALSWRLTEKDDLYFNYFVEKSIDGINWKELEEDLEILQVSDLETVFTIQDNDATRPYIFYRLRHLDCDENNVYSNIVRTDKWLSETEGIFSSNFMVEIDNPKEQQITYQIQDINGKIVKRKMLSDRELAFSDGSQLNDGVYFMFLIDEELHHIIDYKKVTKISE
ncbi:MAG: RCC1 domain-containing protein [Saprospiraceae bacterium]